MDGGGDFHRCIPGFHASRGDRVVKALKKLWDKIKELESKAQSENSYSLTNADSENDETLSDVQSKLLELQLKYIRKLVRERAQAQSQSECLPPNNKVDDDIETSAKKLQRSDSLDRFPVRLQKNTQSSEIAVSCSSDVSDEGSGTTSPPPVKSHKDSRCQIQVADGKDTDRTTQNPLTVSLSCSSIRSLPPARAKTRPHSHYHMKLSDVPFIVGQSTGASHSLTANVQSIIGMMKTHNSALCKASSQSAERFGPCCCCCCCNSTDSKESLATMKEMKRGLKRLARELSDLTVKQEILKQKLESPQHDTQDQTEAFQEYKGISKLMISKAKEIVEFHRKLKNESGKTSPEDAMQKEIPSKIQRGVTAATKQKVPQGKTIEAGRIRHLSSTGYPRPAFSGQLKASDVVWM